MLLYDVRVLCICIYLPRNSATASLCYYPAVAAAAVLLLSAAVRHRVPDDKNCYCFIESDPTVFFLFIKTRLIF